MTKKKFTRPPGSVLKDDGKFYDYQPETIKRDKYFKTNLKRFVDTCLSEVPGENYFNYLQEKVDNRERPINPKDPGYQAIAAIQEMIDKGVSKEAMMDLVRVGWADSMYNVFLTLEAFYIADPTWGLYIQDTKGNPINRIMDDELSTKFEKLEFLPRKKGQKAKSKKITKSPILKKAVKKIK